MAEGGARKRVGVVVIVVGDGGDACGREAGSRFWADPDAGGGSVRRRITISLGLSADNHLLSEKDQFPGLGIELWHDLGSLPAVVDAVGHEADP